MESIIAVDMKSFLLYNGLISDHQFGLKQDNSTLDMLLLLSQQWVEGLDVGHEIRAVFIAISGSGTEPESGTAEKVRTQPRTGTAKNIRVPGSTWTLYWCFGSLANTK